MAEETMPWTRKYMPKKAIDLEGLEKNLSQMRAFVQNFKRGKGLLLYGGTGCGKTSSVYALANELNLELIEINASDSRNADSINSIIGSATKQMSLFFSSKIILVDEVEGIAGREDRGGVLALIKIIEESPFPIILTANDPYTEKLSALRKKCVLLEFETRSHAIILSFLKRICEKEKVAFDEEALSTIARRCGGDLRAALNDLQGCTATNKLTKREVEHLSDRERTDDITTALIKVFKSTDPSMALGAYDNIDEDLDKIFLWVDENLPREYTKPVDLVRGFEAMSRADVFKGRIMRWQHYRFYVYCYNLLSAGIAIAKDEKYKTAADYKQTGRILKLWISNQKNLKKKAIAEKVAAKTHRAKNKALTETIPFLKVIFKHDKKQAKQLAKFFDLDPEQVEWLSS